MRPMASTLLGGRFSRPVLWTTGLVLFVAAFFLPAVRMPPSTGPGTGGADFDGWECAEIVTPIFTLRILQFAVQRRRFPQDPPAWPDLPLLALSGWINPLLLFYLLSCAVRKLRRCRRFLAGFIIVGLIATWFVLARAHFTPLVGHYLWVVGILFMLATPLVGRHSLAHDELSI